MNIRSQGSDSIQRLHGGIGIRTQMTNAYYYELLGAKNQVHSSDRELGPDSYQWNESRTWLLESSI